MVRLLRMMVILPIMRLNMAITSLNFMMIRHLFLVRP